MIVSIVVPVYHGEKTIRLLFREIEFFFKNKEYSYEVIFVWDFGPDQSWKEIEALTQEYPGIIKGIRLNRNFGQHNAIIAAFSLAIGDFIVTMDEDLQHNPHDIEILLKTQKENDFDVVYGNYEMRRHTRFRNTTSTLIKRLIRLGIPEIFPEYSAFRLMKSHIAKETLNMQNSYTFIDGYLSWITSSFGSCEVSHSARIAGSSSYTLRKLIKHSLNIFITFSDLPLKLVSYSSFIFLIFSIFYSLLILYRKLVLSIVIPGYSSTIILLSMGFGLVLFALGVIGEYIHRINQKTTKRPNFIINKII